MKHRPVDFSSSWPSSHRCLPNPYREPYIYNPNQEKEVLIEDLTHHASGIWTWRVRSTDPDDAGSYRTGPDAKGLWKKYGQEFKLINGSFDLNVKGVKGKLEREFSR